MSDKEADFFSDERLQTHLKAAVVCLKAHMMLAGQVCDKDGCRIGPLTWDGLEYLEKVVDEGRVRVEGEKGAEKDAEKEMKHCSNDAVSSAGYMYRGYFIKTFENLELWAVFRGDEKDGDCAPVFDDPGKAMVFVNEKLNV